MERGFFSTTRHHHTELHHETEIIWLEDVEALTYVREAILLVRNRRGKPKIHADDTRLVGYANLGPQAPATNGFARRRVFTLRDYDPYGEEPFQMPEEAVDPRTVEIGVPGRKPLGSGLADEPVN